MFKWSKRDNSSLWDSYKEDRLDVLIEQLVKMRAELKSAQGLYPKYIPVSRNAKSPENTEVSDLRAYILSLTQTVDDLTQIVESMLRSQRRTVRS